MLLDERVRAGCGRAVSGRLSLAFNLKPSTPSGPIRDEVSEAHPILTAASILLDVVEGGTVARDQCDDGISVHTVHRKVFLIRDGLLHRADIRHLGGGPPGRRTGLRRMTNGCDGSRWVVRSGERARSDYVQWAVAINGGTATNVNP